MVLRTDVTDEEPAAVTHAELHNDVNADVNALTILVDDLSDAVAVKMAQ